MLKAIETTYKGYRFRSRVEARYAVMFDEMGADWSYEDEGFVFSNGLRYLPDFHIRSGGLVDGEHYVEIKAKHPDANDFFESMRMRATELGCPILLLTGTPGDSAGMGFFPDRSVTILPLNLGFSGDDMPEEWLRGIKAARSSRFEFGESGAVR